MTTHSGDVVRIGELSRVLEIPAHTLRRMADGGDIPSIRLSDGGHRYFDVSAVRAALAASGTGEFGPAALIPAQSPLFESAYPLVALAEDRVWAQAAERLPPTSDQARAILTYAATEMINNAIDHSQGTMVRVSLWQTSGHIVMTVLDDGEGIFSHVRRGHGLEDNFDAICTLSKGKQTTMASHHSGEGIFFTSKCLDVFRLEANGLRWTIDSLTADQGVGVSDVVVGTRVTCQIDPETTRELSEIFHRYTEDFEFVRSCTSVRLVEIGKRFVSRSEAKRLLNHLDEFRDVTIDFDGVDEVGQGFVDELLRVWPRHNPGTSLHPVNMNPAVEWMVRRGLRTA